jgi:hypothetical protein
MSQSNLLPSAPASQSLDLDDFERRVRCSPAVACGLIFGLPVLGAVVALAAALPLFAALMCGAFLLATVLVCRKALATFTGRTLRLLVTARLVIVLVLGSLLFCTSGNAWVAVVSAVLVWLTADRLLGRRALHDLWKLTRS